MNKNNDTTTASRKLALAILLGVIKEGHSLSSLNHLTDQQDARDVSFARMLSFGVLRYYQQLQFLLSPFMKKKLKPKDIDIQLIILIALYQIIHTRVPDYAAVDVAVKQLRKSKKKWAANLVNAVLRSFLRKLDETPIDELLKTIDTDEANYCHPQWIIDQLKEDWPEQWQQILLANNCQAPMTLRVNQQKISRDDYAALLESEYELASDAFTAAPSALLLEQARDVRQLPGYDEGHFSVQDAGAQLAAQILQPEAGDRILDACAAPGGKTSHLFELQPDINVLALDVSEKRLERVTENCQRLGFSPTIQAADATDTDSWYSGEAFDKILLDVPCSAIGVIRRHPDIKQLRWDDDIDTLVELQRDILSKNWQLLKAGGHLLYATCSLFKAENENQIDWFLNNTDNASLIDISDKVAGADIADSTQHGVQLFPIQGQSDGFYYALLKKSDD